MNFLSVQVREASFYLKIMDSAKSRALKNKEQREYDSIQENPSRDLLVAESDSEELRDDIRSENSRGSNGIRRIPEGVGSDSGIIKRRYFSPTWPMEQRIDEVNKQQKRDGSHILRTILFRINLQRAANQSDPHQVRQLYPIIRISKTKIRLNSSNGKEQNSQAMSTTENTNTDSTYSGNLKQDNRRTKQTRHLRRLLSKERVTHNPVPGVGDNANTGLVRDREKQ
ncbi:MAG: hypothetical protein EZS28_043373, partial [Streblomastix strix]